MWIGVLERLCIIVGEMCVCSNLEWWREKGMAGRQNRIMQDVSEDETNEVCAVECRFVVDCVFPVHYANGVLNCSSYYILVLELHFTTL